MIMVLAVLTTIAAALGSGTLVVTASDGIHVVKLSGEEVVKGAVDKAVGSVRNPVIVGNRVYVIDSSGLLALAVK
jgi:hypothetical protein